MKIGFIGFGNIAKAIARGLAKEPSNVLYAVAPSLAKGITAEGIHTDHDNTSFLPDLDAVILAVKPAKIQEVLQEIKPSLPCHCLVISVASGVSLSSMESCCGHQQAIVRSMPNTPVAVGYGATALFANATTSPQQKQWAERIFSSVGIYTWVKEESAIDTFTALSGSGPAYVFLFMEGLIQAGVALGLDHELARTFTLQTVKGALELAATSHENIRELRKQVTSPGGTTAAAIEVFSQGGLEQLIAQAVDAAAAKAHALGLLAGK